MNIKEEYQVTGMSCTSCANNIEKSVSALEGIKTAKVNFTDKKLTVTYDKSVIKVKDIFKTVKAKGFELTSKDDFDNREQIFLKKEKRRLILAWLITIPLSVKMLLHMIWGIHFISGKPSLLFDMVLSFVVIFIVGYPVIKTTFKSIISFNFNMDSLIGIGSIAAYSSGVIILVGGSIENFVSIGAMIMSINFIGNYLKLLATGRASQAIKKLLELGANSAFVLEEDGTTVEKSIEQLVIGDTVLVKPGEKIPVDGVIVFGNTTIDESIATGESMPVDKGEGDSVIGGTINHVGVIKVKIEKLGNETFLSRIVAMVEEAQSSRVPIQAFADKVTSVFVPVILVIALLTFIFWFVFPDFGTSILVLFKDYIPWVDPDRGILSTALFASIASLVIACPCALGLATPTALMVGMGKGALNGVLIRNGEAIQKAKDIDVVVFDKTGTITKGEPRLNRIKSEIGDKKLLKIVASVESHSEHPLAKAIMRKTEELNIVTTEPKDFKAIPGKGLTAKVDDNNVLISSISYIKEIGVELTEYNDFILESLNLGQTVIGAVINGDIKGVISISDEVKDDSKKAITSLHSLGIKTVMLTGDNKKAALAIASEVGIDRVEAELLPDDKIDIVKKLQELGHTVSMVGDGINDAPALKQSDVGIAIGTGTDIAIESADITLVTGSLNGVVKGIKLSKATFKKIKQNLFWAFFYNVIAIPLAITALLHPAIAEVAMAFSSINVVLNSLRLKNTNI